QILFTGNPRWLGDFAERACGAGLPSKGEHRLRLTQPESTFVAPRPSARIVRCARRAVASGVSQEASSDAPGGRAVAGPAAGRALGQTRWRTLRLAGIARGSL